MDLKLRNKYKSILKYKHKDYLTSLEDNIINTVNLGSRFKNLQNKIIAQLRKTEKSASSVKGIPTICKILFGLQEDIVGLSLPGYSFSTENEIVNMFIISYLEDQRITQFNGECAFYGETLLNLYIDLFITLTCIKTPREIENKPEFLVNPLTNQQLELDVILEDFLLAFEFQGESHYREEKEIVKDRYKLSICANNKFILIPVNIHQLESNRLMRLILNSIKDAIDINNEVINLVGGGSLKINSKHLLSFKKACQRMYLAHTLFKESIIWLDKYSARFRETQANRNPISSSSEAPRLVAKNSDMSIEELYFSLKNI
jgi:hypothetical protein